MASLIRTYRRLLHERPLITNVMTTCVFMSSGDLISQSILSNNQDLDLKRTGRFALAGLIFVGPAVRGCLVMIDKIFGPTKSLVVLGQKLLFDQVICAPSFLAGNLTTLTLLKTQNFEEVKFEFERSYFELLKLNYTFWPFVQVINFYLIPLTYRVLFGSSAALLWNTAVSYTLHLKPKEDLTEEATKEL